MDFKTAEETFKRAKDKNRGYCLPGRLGQTRLVKTEAGYGIKYVDTVVVEILPNDNYVLNNAGFYTKTTKERINQYAPVRLGQAKSLWYLYNGDYNNRIATPFFNGITVDKEGNVLNASNTGTKEAAKRLKLLKDVDKYATGFANKIKAGKLPEPGAGDCWCCSMVDANTGKDNVMGSDHFISHMKEKYYVPSLLVNAVKAKGYNPYMINPWNGIMREPAFFKRAIKSYVLNYLGKETK